MRQRSDLRALFPFQIQRHTEARAAEARPLCPAGSLEDDHEARAVYRPAQGALLPPERIGELGVGERVGGAQRLHLARAEAQRGDARGPPELEARDRVVLVEGEVCIRSEVDAEPSLERRLPVRARRTAGGEHERVLCGVVERAVTVIGIEDDIHDGASRGRGLYPPRGMEGSLSSGDVDAASGAAGAGERSAADAEGGEDTPPRRRRWHQRLLQPLRAQLTQGVSVDQLSWTLAVGTGCSMFPLLGTTSLLNLVVGAAMRMNQPVLQTLNQVLAPVHLAMILVYVRLGETLLGAHGEARFAVFEMIQAFRDLPFGEFLARFGRAGLHAILGWAVTLPVLVLVVRAVLRPMLTRLATRLPRRGPLARG